MHFRSRLTIAGFTLAGVLTLALLVVSFLPSQFGGHTTYLRVHGISMLPTFHTDDIVLVRPADHYAVGDVVGYHNPDLGIVIHRIIAMDGDRFVIRGDNNNFDDRYHPLPSEVIGKRWFYIPGGAHLADKVKPPLGPSVASGLAFGSVVIPAAGKRRGKGKRGQSPGGSGGFGPLSPLGVGLLSTAGIGLFVGIIAMAVGYTRSTTHQVSVQSKYQQEGKFSYSASGPPSAYGDGEVHPGDPLFLKVVDAMNVQFTYGFSGGDHIQGDASLDLVVWQTNGWQKVINLSPDKTFYGDSTVLSAKVDLGAVRQAIADVEASTGIHYDTYFARLAPHVKATASVGGTPVKETFDPQFGFKWDQNQLQVANSDSAGTDPYDQVRGGMAPHQTLHAARFSVLVVSMPVSILRIFGMAITVASALALLITALWLRASRTSDEAAAIARQYGSLLIDATSTPLQPGLPQFSVKRFRDLVELAMPDASRIFHDVPAETDQHRYIVIRPEAAYLYTVRRPPTPGWRAALPIAPRDQDTGESRLARFPKKSIAGAIILLFTAAVLTLHAGAASAGDTQLPAVTPTVQAATASHTMTGSLASTR